MKHMIFSCEISMINVEWWNIHGNNYFNTVLTNYAHPIEGSYRSNPIVISSHNIQHVLVLNSDKSVHIYLNSRYQPTHRVYVFTEALNHARRWNPISRTSQVWFHGDAMHLSLSLFGLPTLLTTRSKSRFGLYLGRLFWPISRKMV